VGGNTLDMTKGSAWKLIVQFAVPVFLSQVFQQLYNTADALIVGLLFGWTVSM
jgi:Na+-driven multidrug efflux pump